MSQYHNIILFGAGASVDAGIPLLGLFVDTMWELAYRGQIGGNRLSEEDHQVFRAANGVRELLERYSSRAYFDLRSLEDILSLLSA